METWPEIGLGGFNQGCMTVCMNMESIGVTSCTYLWIYDISLCLLLISFLDLLSRYVDCTCVRDRSKTLICEAKQIFHICRCTKKNRKTGTTLRLVAFSCSAFCASWNAIPTEEGQSMVRGPGAWGENAWEATYLCSRSIGKRIASYFQSSFVRIMFQAGPRIFQDLKGTSVTLSVFRGWSYYHVLSPHPGVGRRQHRRLQDLEMMDGGTQVLHLPISQWLGEGCSTPWGNLRERLPNWSK